MKCKICNNESRKIFSAKILNKYNISYFYCENCSFLQTEKPYWLEESYKESINLSDTGILSRNLYLSKLSSLIIFFLFNKKGKFLDYAGGYGIFTRLMRDIGFDFYWHDKFTKNLMARGFEYNNSDQIDLITCFEAFEHFERPIVEIESMLKISGSILFSTELLPNPVPKPDKWWYYGLNHGQHISFYSKRTLRYIAERYNLNLCTNGSTIHLFIDKKMNNLIFNLILKMGRLGLNNVLRKFLKSRTIEDWKLLQ